jgi:hypothetical protein
MVQRIEFPFLGQFKTFQFDTIQNTLVPSHWHGNQSKQRTLESNICDVDVINADVM